MERFEVEQKVAETLKTLKGFQKATVERIDELYRMGQGRVLVADEVGLGKTFVAKGVIAKMALLRKEEGDKLFKVVYICQNSSIINQNIHKITLDRDSISEKDTVRLSMQHLSIAENTYGTRFRNEYFSIIALSPLTSFKIVSKQGTCDERALIYNILCRMNNLGVSNARLRTLLRNKVNEGSWKDAVEKYKKKVYDCEINSNGKYPRNLISKIENKVRNILRDFTDIRDKFACGEIIRKLRYEFAKASVSMLEPDLVIMDEFQRFSELLMCGKNQDTEMGQLVDAFFRVKKSQKLRVLLLSATPFKAYSTIEERNYNGEDEHIKGFNDLTNFLFRGDVEDFDKKWALYRQKMNNFNIADKDLFVCKREAEDALYRGMCRTERFSILSIVEKERNDINNADYLEEHLDEVIVSEKDILSYLKLGGIAKRLKIREPIIEYVKSAPYLMSFLKDYKVKKSIEKCFKDDVDLRSNVRKLNDPLLWVQRGNVSQLSKLNITNSKLDYLLRKIFTEKREERFLWVPPTRPYYGMKGAYTHSNDAVDGFTKTLVFSSWAMVPKMIGTLISYESERLSIGAIGDKVNYTTQKGYPKQRLIRKSKTNKFKNILTLVYPSRTLASLYNPIKMFNDKKSLKEIETAIRRVITEKMKPFKNAHKGKAGKIDKRWYYVAPMIWDGVDYFKKWCDLNNNRYNLSDGLLEIVLNNGVSLERLPDDLCDVLVNMVLGSPAICLYRALQLENVSETFIDAVDSFVSYFNQPESIAKICLTYNRKSDEDSYWNHVLEYSKDGCFQAVIDEYIYLLRESNSVDGVLKEIKNVLDYKTVSFEVDTYQSFEKKVARGRYDSNTENGKGLRMRCNFATPFVNTKSDDNKSSQRKEDIRKAFNSPFYPFVLATTSIGQEGLDFHLYCRRIIHWNLPHNPIDIEQREGRINRYKCLAIRQSIVADNIDCVHHENIWEELFENAKRKSGEVGNLDLIPYWYVKNSKVKIQRFVPMYTFSKDVRKYKKLIEILAHYRLTLGQARQEEVLKYILKNVSSYEIPTDMFINLCPATKN